MIRVLLPFFCGAWIGLHLHSGIRPGALFVFSVIPWVAVLVIFISKRQYPGPALWIISVMLFLIFTTLGMANGILAQPEDPGFPVDRQVFVRGEILGAPQRGLYGYSFDLELDCLFSEDACRRSGTLLKCYLSMPADSILPAAGEFWQFSGNLRTIQASRNPGSPDYRSILGRKNMWYRFYIASSGVPGLYNRKLDGGLKRHIGAILRKKVSDHWYGNEEEVSLLKAVCLGDRSAMSDDLVRVYSQAGGMHLLAVSGLHVGLIWLVLQYMTGWMRLIFKKGTQQIILVLGILWFYAFITGFSSSVCRSVTMFSCISLSRMMGERGRSLNALFVSAFLLVLIKPTRLLDPGFQLSYMAVLGILVLFPLASGLFRVKHRILRWIWEASLLSLSAQLSTAPLVIYYFHQLPLYSLLTSLLAIPLLSMLIAVFVCSVPFLAMGIMDQHFSFVLVKMARLMNRSVEYPGSLPGAVLSGMQLDRMDLLLWILIFLSFLLAISARRRMPRYMLLFLLSAQLGWSSLGYLQQRFSSEMIIAHVRGASILSYRNGLQADHYCWYRDSTAMYQVEAYISGTRVRRIFENRVHVQDRGTDSKGLVSECIMISEGAWLVGAPACYGLVLKQTLPVSIWNFLYNDSAKSFLFPADFILLSGEPWLNVPPGCKKLDQTTLIIDGSNSSWYERSMAAVLEGIYLTDRSGAYVKRW